MNMIAKTAECIVWVAVNERGETAASVISAEKAEVSLKLGDYPRAEVYQVYRCRATLPIPVVATVDMTAERVEP